MKCILAIALAIICLSAVLAADKPDRGLNIDRIKAADKNQDGLLTEDEIGPIAWKRLSAFDANADGKLDAKEMAALQGAKGRNSEEPRRPGGANSAFTVKEFKSKDDLSLRYSLFGPADAAANLPLVLCLHGAGGNTAAANVLAGPELQKKYPCHVLAPACEGRSVRWVEFSFRGGPQQRAVTPELMEMLDAVIKETKADPARIYLTGQSMGGIGTWGLVAKFPDRFAAAAPICGIWDPADAAKMVKVPLWTFHGANDTTVPVEGSRKMIEALKAAGGSPKYTELPNVGHGSWDPAYATPELWAWMFEQRQAK